MPLSLRAAVKEVEDISFLTARAFFSAFRRPYYFRDIIQQMDSIGVGSIPVVALTGFFTGAVLALQSAKTLSTFGAVGQTGRAVGISLVKELGPVIGSLMVAGRSGSGMASELGSMVVTEQVNAMRALGTDPVKKLVVPRVLATTLMMPLLTIVADTCGILGGLAIAKTSIHISSAQYFSSAWNGLTHGDLVGGLIKPLVFGLIISIVGCHMGLQTHGGTQGVGRSTTQAVVQASVWILVWDFLLTKVILLYT
jgi:phospholipid/cholesterol/gamma-HCH transport system permease protein